MSTLRSDVLPVMQRFLLLLVTALCLVVSIGVTPAHAEPTEEQVQQARSEAASAGAKKACEVIVPWHLEDFREDCEKVTKPAILAVQELQDVEVKDICNAASGIPGVGVTCAVALSPVWSMVSSVITSTYETALQKVTEAGAGLVSGAVEATEFITNPASAFEKIVNTVRDGAVDLLNRVMGELVQVGNPDFTASWWRESYAAAGGIGLLVAAFMVLFLLKDASAEKISSQQLAEGMQYLLGGIVAMFFAPVIAYVVQSGIADFNKGIVEWGGPDLYEVVLKGSIFSMTATALPGGILMGFFFFLMLFLAALLVFVMFILQGMAVLITSIAMAIGFGMLAHPRWRARALRIPMMVLGIMLAKPLLLFVMTVLFKMIDAFDPLTGIKGDPIRMLGEAVMVLLALLMIGLAPWTAFRLMPLLPNGSEIDGGGFNPAAGLAGAGAGVAMTTVAFQRMGGSGSSGSGDGSSADRGAPPAGQSRADGQAGEGGKGGADGASGPAGSGKTGPKGDAGASGAAGRVGTSGESSAAGATGAASGASAGSGASAATAAGGVLTGGALLVAAAAAKSAQTGLQVGRQAAENAAPGQETYHQEEMQSSLHDRRKWGDD